MIKLLGFAAVIESYRFTGSTKYEVLEVRR